MKEGYTLHDGINLLQLTEYYCSHKQEKIVIARKLKKTAITEQKEATRKDINLQIQKIKEDRETLTRKKDVAEQLYETPQGKRITGRDLDKMFLEEEERLQRIEQEVVGQLDEEEKQEDDNKDDKATKSSGSDNSTPPKLFLGYALMVCTLKFNANFILLRLVIISDTTRYI